MWLSVAACRNNETLLIISGSVLTTLEAFHMFHGMASVAHYSIRSCRDEKAVSIGPVFDNLGNIQGERMYILSHVNIFVCGTNSSVRFKEGARVGVMLEVRWSARLLDK
jgi:hypothetical protein